MKSKAQATVTPSIELSFQLPTRTDLCNLGVAGSSSKDWTQWALFAPLTDVENIVESFEAAAKALRDTFDLLRAN